MVLVLKVFVLATPYVQIYSASFDQCTFLHWGIVFDTIIQRTEPARVTIQKERSKGVYRTWSNAQLAGTAKGFFAFVRQSSSEFAARGASFSPHVITASCPGATKNPVTRCHISASACQTQSVTWLQENLCKRYYPTPGKRRGTWHRSGRA